MRTRLFESMRLQTALVVVVGLALSHVAGYLLYTQDRRETVFMTEALDLAERIAGLSRVLRDVPESWREEVVRRSDRNAFRIWTSKEPYLEVAEATEAELLFLDYLRAQVPRIAKNDMRVRFRSDAGGPIETPGHLESGGVPAEDEVHSGPVVAVSLSHAEGEWLNVVGHINNPRSMLPELLGASVVSAVLGIGLVAFWLVHRVTVPLARLSSAAERIGKNIYTEPLEESGPREVTKAAEAFNRMQRRLTRLIEARTELLAAISHDLRTPITQLRLRTELMPTSTERTKNLATLDEMEAIVATFLDYARATNETEEQRLIDLGTLVESICTDLADGGAEIAWEVKDGLILSCKRLAIKRGLSNLIDNALKFGTRAQVEATRTADGILVRIDDDGPGIPEEELDAVFAPFHRGAGSAGRPAGGTGLGLSIAQAVIEDHGGEIQLTNRQAGGLRVEVLLPIK